MLDLLTSIAADPNTLLVIGGLVLAAIFGYVALVVASYMKHRRR